MAGNVGIDISVISSSCKIAQNITSMCGVGGKVDVLPPVALIVLAVLTMVVLTPIGVCIVDEIPRESLALESPVNSVLAQGIEPRVILC
jgi:hypothetical protein